MNILISDKKKKETFVSLFQVLKNCSSVVNIMFNIEHVHIQGMDKSHICLFNIKITKEWFSNYDIKEVTKISFDTNIFHSIISTKSDNQDLIIIMDDVDQDILHINFLSQEKESKKNEFNKFFKMPLIEYVY